ncbi:unnamed protein product [Amoebophrya sp. A120]|nr:unnamed protein product [Amoebophrya sp. A120]|eukprot:GSA120T00017924001.1
MLADLLYDFVAFPALVAVFVVFLIQFFPAVLAQPGTSTSANTALPKAVPASNNSTAEEPANGTTIPTRDDNHLAAQRSRQRGTTSSAAPRLSGVTRNKCEGAPARHDVQDAVSFVLPTYPPAADEVSVLSHLPLSSGTAPGDDSAIREEEETTPMQEEVSTSNTVFMPEVDLSMVEETPRETLEELSFEQGSFTEDRRARTTTSTSCASRGSASSPDITIRTAESPELEKLPDSVVESSTQPDDSRMDDGTSGCSPMGGVFGSQASSPSSFQYKRECSSGTSSVGGGLLQHKMSATHEGTSLTMEEYAAQPPVHNFHPMSPTASTTDIAYPNCPETPPGNSYGVPTPHLGYYGPQMYHPHMCYDPRAGPPPGMWPGMMPSPMMSPPPGPMMWPASPEDYYHNYHEGVTAAGAYYGYNPAHVVHPQHAATGFDGTRGQRSSTTCGASSTDLLTTACSPDDEDLLETAGGAGQKTGTRKSESRSSPDEGEREIAKPRKNPRHVRRLDYLESDPEVDCSDGNDEAQREAGSCDGRAGFDGSESRDATAAHPHQYGYKNDARPPAQQHLARTAAVQQHPGQIRTKFASVPNYVPPLPSAPPAKRKKIPLPASSPCGSGSGISDLAGSGTTPGPAAQPRISTLMIRHLPCKLTFQELEDALTEHGFVQGVCYDFLYLPQDLVNNTNRGYAFINLLPVKQKTVAEVESGSKDDQHSIGSEQDSTSSYDEAALLSQVTQRFRSVFCRYQFHKKSSKLAHVVNAHLQGFTALCDHFHRTVVKKHKNCIFIKDQVEPDYTVGAGTPTDEGPTVPAGRGRPELAEEHGGTYVKSQSK